MTSPKPSLPRGSNVGDVRTSPCTNTVGFVATRCTNSRSPLGSVVTTGSTALCSVSGFASAAFIHAGCTSGPFEVRSPKLSLTDDVTLDGGCASPALTPGWSVATTLAFA